MSLIKISEITPEQIASVCDHTFLFRSEQYFNKNSPQEKSAMQLRKEDFLKFLSEAIQFPLSPYAFCVRPEDVKFTKEYLNQKNMENIKIASVVGFPDGSWYSPDFKIAETELAIKHGAKEIDMVLNYEKINDPLNYFHFQDIYHITKSIHKKGGLAKLILETSELSPPQIIFGCKIANDLKVDFVKTSTGFGKYGARSEDAKLMRQFFRGKGVKVSGGIRTLNQTKELLYAISGREDGYIDLDPMKVRIGESSLLKNIQ